MNRTSDSEIYARMAAAVSTFNGIIKNDDIMECHPQECRDTRSECPPLNTQPYNDLIDELCDECDRRLRASSVREHPELLDALSLAVFGIALESPRRHRAALYSRHAWWLLDETCLLPETPSVARHRHNLMLLVPEKERELMIENLI